MATNPFAPKPGTETLDTTLDPSLVKGDAKLPTPESFTPPTTEDGAAIISAAESGKVLPDTEGAIYSSHPIQNFAIGPYQFVKGVLNLAHEAVDEFETFLGGFPLVIQNQIKKLDVGKAGAIAAQFLESAATKSMDSSVGRAALAALQSRNSAIGTQDIVAESDAKIAGTYIDGNQPIPTLVDPKTGAPIATAGLAAVPAGALGLTDPAVAAAGGQGAVETEEHPLDANAGNQ